MSEEKTNVGTAEPTKKMRRGVNNATKAVSQMKFHEKDAAQNSLFIGHLEDVSVDYSVASENTSFAGLNMPRLTLHFASNHTDKSQMRHVYHTLFPIESNVDTIPGGNNAWRVDNVFAWIKYILDVFYLKGRQLTEKEEDALALNFQDFDENTNEYISVDPQVVLDSYATIFNNTVAMLEGRFNDLAEGETPKCCYKDANGKPIAIWMKLLRHIRSKKGWTNVAPNGDLAFPQFIGSGVIEICKTNTPPVIVRLDPTKESITPKETKKEPTFGGQGIPSMGAIQVPGMGMGAGIDNTAFNEAAVGDMPF